MKSPGPYMQELRERLQLLLDEQGFSQRELASEAGMTETQLSRALTGNATPSGENAISLWELAKKLTETGSAPGGLVQTDEAAQTTSSQYETSGAESVKPLGPIQVWPGISRNEDGFQIPSEARLLVRWLPRVETSPIQCIGVINSEGGRRILPRSSAIDRRVTNLEKSLNTVPFKADEFGTDRLRLARFVAASWLIQISYVQSKGFNFCIISPQDAVPIGSKVDVFASQPEILELYPPTKDATVLDEELKQVAKEFARLLDKFDEV